LTDATFKEADAASYDDHAEAYARFVPRLAGPLAEEIVSLAALAPGDRVLDVGCGTGLASAAAAAAVAPSGSVVGVDLSRGMLAAAARRLEGAPNGRLVELRRMDAERLDLPDGAFDAVVSLCAILHFPQLGQALREMQRVLAPGGRLVVAFGSGRPNALFAFAAYAPRRLARLLAARVRPELRAPERLIAISERYAPDPPEPVLTPWASGRPLPYLLRSLRAAGFQVARTSWKGSDVRFSSPEELWEAQLAIATEVRKRLAHADERVVERVRGAFEAEARRVLDRRGRLVYPYGATFVCARKPSQG
jgi:ubiquinone/menaquinone biosynthesis C-methylase UbiE